MYYSPLNSSFTSPSFPLPLPPLYEPQALLEPVTGPLVALTGKRILVLADVENLRYGARDLGYKVSFQKLGECLKSQTSIEGLHAFYSRNPQHTHLDSYFEKRGWKPKPRMIEVVQTGRGLQKKANSDNTLLFYAGLLVSRSTADTVLIASGDGDLVLDLAKCIQQLPKQRDVVTLSLPCSTSWRLEATKTTCISANLEIGLDCLRPN